MRFFALLYVNGPHAAPSGATGAADLVTSDLRGRLSKLVSGYTFHLAPLSERHNSVLQQVQKVFRPPSIFYKINTEISHGYMYSDAFVEDRGVLLGMNQQDIRSTATQS